MCTTASWYVQSLKPNQRIPFKPNEQTENYKQGIHETISEPELANSLTMPFNEKKRHSKPELAFTNRKRGRHKPTNINQSRRPNCTRFFRLHVFKCKSCVRE